MPQEYLKPTAWIELADAANENRSKLDLTLNDIFTTAECAAKTGTYEIRVVVDQSVADDVLARLEMMGYWVSTQWSEGYPIVIFTITPNPPVDVPA